MSVRLYKAQDLSNRRTERALFFYRYWSCLEYQHKSKICSMTDRLMNEVSCILDGKGYRHPKQT